MATSYAADNFIRAVELTGCDNHGADSPKSLECLRSLPVEKLIDIEVQIGQQFAALAGVDAFGPVVDGDFFPDVPSALFKSGRFTKVPMIIGWNEDDGSLFAPATISTQDELVAHLLKLVPGFSKATIKRVLSLYPTSDFQDFPDVNLTAQWSRASRIVRELEFVCPSLFVALQVANHQSHHASDDFFEAALGSQKPLENKNTPSAPIFLYHLNQTSLGTVLDAQGLTFLGISHTADIPYVFDEVSRFNDSATNILLAKQMSGSWSRFASTGVPSSSKGASIQGWEPAFGPRGKAELGNAKVMVIGGGQPGMSGLDGGNDALVNERLVERCGFFFDEKVIRQVGT